MDDKINLPNGSDLIIRMAYSSKEANGVTVLVVISSISLLAVVALLTVIAISAFNTRREKDPHLFVRTHIAAYFICLLFCDIIQALASMLNAKWVSSMAVSAGNTCTVQGVMKQASDVGAAFWTLVIAFHTFGLLVLEIKVGPLVLWSTLVLGWAVIATIVIGGAATMDVEQRGPFYGVSGYWCWITDGYRAERLTLDYMIMFLAAFFSFIIYTLIFLRLRGNLVVTDSRFYFKRVSSESALGWRNCHFENKTMAIARQMLLYPVAYPVLILPIAITRFSAFAGSKVPFEATIFSAAVFLLSGIVNVVLFSTTRRILPPNSMTVRLGRSSGPDTNQQPPNPRPISQESIQTMETDSESCYSKDSMPQPSFQPSARGVSFNNPSHRREMPKSSRGAHLPAITVPHRDDITGATRMYAFDGPNPDEYKEVSLGSHSGRIVASGRAF